MPMKSPAFRPAHSSSFFAAFAALAGFTFAACGGRVDDRGATPLPPPDVAPSRCIAPEDVDNNPSTIADTVTLINALLDQQEGEALTLPCFLESLQRPLRLNGTVSRVSAQPAVGAKNPRLFLQTPDMWLSVVPEGSGQPFLEIGQLTSPNRSIKAEIEFPIHAPLTEASPFERLPFGEVTTCGLCHAEEKPMLGIPHAVESKALRPAPNTIVRLDDIVSAYEECDSEETPERCAIYEALFAHGDVEEELFPADMPTIFKPNP